MQNSSKSSESKRNLEDHGLLRSDPRCVDGEWDPTLVEKASKGLLKIPDFLSFSNLIEEIHQTILLEDGGENAQYIPVLKDQNPKKCGVGICTVDGQRCFFGDSKEPWSIQSTCKPVLYGLALERCGEEMVDKYVGCEPSGMAFNEIKLNPKGIPHNPLNNPGAIAVTSLLCDPAYGSQSDHLAHLLSSFSLLTGSTEIAQSDAIVYQSEKDTATRNRAIAFTIKETNEDKPVGFPDHIVSDEYDVPRVLNLYLQACSIISDCRRMSVLGGTLANGGTCPLTGVQVFSPETVKRVLSSMDSCGMYTYSGEFKKKYGFPAKSGVSGIILFIVPGVLGGAVWSPRLDKHHNSVRGIKFCELLSQRFNFHCYDLVTPRGDKIDPLVSSLQNEGFGVYMSLQYATHGKLEEIKSLHLRFYDLSKSDHDARTPLHLAACEGHLEIIRFLVDEVCVPKNPLDRWGHSPLDDAKTYDHLEIVEFLSSE